MKVPVRWMGTLKEQKDLLNWPESINERSYRTRDCDRVQNPGGGADGAGGCLVNEKRPQSALVGRCGRLCVLFIRHCPAGAEASSNPAHFLFQILLLFSHKFKFCDIMVEPSGALLNLAITWKLKAGSGTITKTV